MTSEAQVTPCIEYWLRFLKESRIDAEPVEIWWNYGDDTDACLIAEYDLSSIIGVQKILELCFYPDGRIEYDYPSNDVISEWGFKHIDDWYLTTLKRITRMFP